MLLSPERTTPAKTKVNGGRQRAPDTDKRPDFTLPLVSSKQQSANAKQPLVLLKSTFERICRNAGQKVLDVMISLIPCFIRFFLIENRKLIQKTKGLVYFVASKEVPIAQLSGVTTIISSGK